MARRLRFRIRGHTFTLRGSGVGICDLWPYRNPGWYEQVEIQMAVHHLPRDTPLIELGACFGVVSCITNRLLDDGKKHVVVEANPLRLPTIQRNRDLNRATFQTIHGAIAYGSEAVRFRTDGPPMGCRLDEGGDRVPTTSIAKILDDTGWERISLIADIEGGEIGLVQNESDVLKRCVATIILEIHPEIVGEAANKEMMLTLTGLGFSEVERIKSVVVLKNRALE